jgi:hypothetical protein
MPRNLKMVEYLPPPKHQRATNYSTTHIVHMVLCDLARLLAWCDGGRPWRRSITMPSRAR